MSGAMTWERAAAALKLTGRHRGRVLKRKVFQKEAKLGILIATRRGTPKKPEYRVTLGALRQHMPELFERKSRVDTLRATVQGYLREVDDRIAAGVAKHCDLYIDPRLDELWGRDETIAEQVSELAAAVAELKNAPANRH